MEELKVELGKCRSSCCWPNLTERGSLIGRDGWGVEGRQPCNLVVLILEPHLEFVLKHKRHLLARMGCSASSFLAVERARDQYW